MIYKRGQEKSRLYAQHFEGSGLKTADDGPGGNEADWQDQIIAIINEVCRVDGEQEPFVLEQLGIHPIWNKTTKKSRRSLKRYRNSLGEHQRYCAGVVARL